MDPVSWCAREELPPACKCKDKCIRWSSLRNDRFVNVASVQMSSYETLRRQSRTLESLLDAKLTSYTALASSISRGQDIETGGSSERWKDLESEVEGLLDKVRTTFN
jgi:hypothetical protein